MYLKPSSKIFLLTVTRRYFFCGSFVLFMYCACHAFASVRCCLVVTCWERADLLALVCDVYCVFVTFPCGILGQVWYLIVSFPDLCRLYYFDKVPSRRPGMNWITFCKINLMYEPAHEVCRLSAVVTKTNLKHIKHSFVSYFLLLSTSLTRLSELEPRREMISEKILVR